MDPDRVVVHGVGWVVIGRERERRKNAFRRGGLGVVSEVVSAYRLKV